LPSNSKTTNHTKYSRLLLKSWLKTLSNEYIYAEQIEQTMELEIFASKVDHVAVKAGYQFLLSFDFEDRYRRRRR
jgi:hypothetical protein